MITQKTNPRTYGELLNGYSPAQNEPVWLAKIRETAFERFQTLKFPTRKNEAWKYINLDPILNSPFVPISTTRTVLREQFSENCSNLVPNLKKLIETKPDLVKPFLAVNLMQEPNVFLLANTFQFEDGFFINGKEKSPIQIVFVENENKPIVFHPRILIALEANVKAEVIITHIGTGTGQAFMNAVLEIHLAPNAELHVTFVQKNAYQFMTTRAYLSEKSKLETVSITENGVLSRNETLVEFKGKEAFASLSGLSVLEKASQVFHHGTANHAVPECTSRQLYKTILADEAKSEFNSLVYMHHGAQKSDSNQLNRNLLLSDTARAYSRPQLQIFADDVKATHGAATGQLEKQELFYLESRGLSRETARLLLMYGFAEEVIERIKNKTLKNNLKESVRKSLESMVTQ